MRFLWLLLAVGAAAQLDDYVEEELEDSYREDDYEHSRSKREADGLSDVYSVPRTGEELPPGRARRDLHDEGPYEEHVRVKRCTYEDVPLSRLRRSAAYTRTPRQVHQYEVHEVTDDGYPSSPPYEEMLAASAEHYHKVYAAPGAPHAARYLSPDVSSIPVVYRPVSSVSSVSSEPGHPALAAARGAPVQYRAPTQFVPVQASIKVADVPQAVASGPGVAQAAPAGDQLEAAAGEHQHHHKHHEQGGGHTKHAHHDAHKGGKSSKGFKHSQHVDKGAKGSKTDELHRKQYEEAQGKQKKHHDHAGHKGSHEEQAHGHKGSKFDEKKGHKKGHKTKGYHNKYHKDEFHKEHKFYDDYHKSGEHHRFGNFHAKHASDESGKKKAHHVDAGHDFVERGKKGYSNKGHLDADHKGHRGKQGHEEHHEHHTEHAKKGGKEGGAQWKHAKKN